MLIRKALMWFVVTTITVMMLSSSWIYSTLNAQNPLFVDASNDPALQFSDISNPQALSETQGESKWAMGILVTLKLQSKDSNGAYAIFEDYILPGVGTPLHIHTREEEFWFMLDGELEWYVGDRLFNAKQGDFINTSRGIPHRFQNISNKPAKMLLGYAPAGFEQWFIDIGQPVTNAKIPPKTTPEDIEKAIKVAQEYGVNFIKP
ncbi:Cupin 2 conserved barrel domain protein [Rippkaea orientalis PCC 8801]|uniref:Cupin 2 conserved barrel domain protein n=1 Tax=Rippkaea orientalis (strain PCC 8801 / RF-1) TaxID=41431 RepID=B7K0Q7_RIPO1|nr:cupin domain-containing protein [Rippkaea orientalis]ACK64211.1 Cupin 2 conserved barrel domain protein [Rippkaea orientalis PCC 8801]